MGTNSFYFHEMIFIFLSLCFVYVAFSYLCFWYMACFLMIWSTILPFCCLSCCISFVSFYVNIFAFMVLIFWTFVIGTWYHHFLVCNLVSMCCPFFKKLLQHGPKFYHVFLSLDIGTFVTYHFEFHLFVFYVNTFAFMMLFFGHLFLTLDITISLLAT